MVLSFLPYSDISAGCLGSNGVSLLSEGEGKARDAQGGRPSNPAAQRHPESHAASGPAHPTSYPQKKEVRSFVVTSQVTPILRNSWSRACWGQRGRGEAPLAVNLRFMSTYYVPGSIRLRDHQMNNQGYFPSETIRAVGAQLKF